MSVQSDATTDDERAPDDGGDETAVELTKDDAFHLLQNTRRRAVLRYFAEHDDQERFVMRDIAEDIAAWEHETTVVQLTSKERQRVYIALYQSHLPKLDEHGIIEYNQARGIIRPTPLAAAFGPFIEDTLDADDDLTVAQPAESTDTEETSTFSRTVSSFFRR